MTRRQLIPRKVWLLALIAFAFVLAPGTAEATTSPSYSNVVFSDGFESGSLSAWDGSLGTGLIGVMGTAAHSGTNGVRFTNSPGQYGLVTKTLSTALTDSSVSFWARIAPGGGLQTLAQARDGSSSASMWGLLYDGSQQGLWFYPFRGSASQEIFTGAGSAPAGSWFKVEIQYSATSNGGAQLYINDQTQASWGVSGDYTRTANLQKLQLWDDTSATTDFDDVTIGTPPTVATAPNAPTNVTGTPGDQSVRLNWTAPAFNGGSAITGYRITPSINGTAQAPINTGSTATTFNVTGLTNGTAYTFKVAAINSVGTGADSAASSAITPAAPTAPGAPTAVSGTPGDGTVALQWTSPASDGGSAITGYRVTPSINGTAQAPINTGSTATTFNVTGLTNGTAYTFTVAAINSVGTGADSAASSAITPAAPTSKYTNVVFNDGFESGSFASWTGTPGTGSATVVAAAANTGAYGARLTNTAGQLRLAVKTLSAPLVDSSTRFYVRVGSAAGLQTIAQARDQSSSATMWGLLYDGAHQGFYFYPYRGTSATEIYTGNNSAPLNTWVQVEVQYNGATGGGAQLYINGQTQSSWGVSGDYTRSTSYQTLQLWNDVANTTDYDNVTVAAPPTGVAAPGAPTGVTGTSGDSSVALQWTAPASNGGSAITGYRVTPYINGTAQTAINTGSTATSYNVTGLTNGTAYTFKVAATNSVGTGADSTASGTITPMAVPGAPTGVTGTSGDASVALQWTAPASNGGSAITGYRVTPFINGAAQTPINTGSTAASYTVTGLTNGTAYTFKVAAINSVGTGADSAASSAITPAGATGTGTGPGAPTNVAGTSGNQSIQLTWTAPSSDGGSAIVGYRITPSINGTAQTPINTPSAATSFNVTGLTNGTAYTFTVAAVNGVATGPDSAASSAITPMTTPGAPTSVTGNPGDRMVAVHWTAPASNGGSAITGYRITPSINGTAQTPINTGSNAIMYNVTGLTNGTAYTFKVAAINSVGTGPDSAASSAVTPAAPPPATTIVSLTFDDSIATQFQALPMLQAHNMHATFYVNSGLILDNVTWHMSWDQVRQLAAAGNEIGGHSWDHADLTTLSTADQQHEICDDRTNIANHGLPLPTNFAYPFGAYEQNNVPAMVAFCGYDSARQVGGIRSSLCPTNCPYAESIPPVSPYVTNTAPDVKLTDTLATVEGYITQAEQHGGGWVQLVFHDICATGCDGDTFSTSPTLLNGLMDWLQPRAANGTVVKTVAQVLNDAPGP